MRPLSWVAALAAALFACEAHEHEHGHEHGEGAAVAEDPRPGLSFTVYADGLELFMETPAFVVGQPSPLVAHFTDAHNPRGFVWITEGAVTATLSWRDGTQEVFQVDHLLRSGIFKPVVTPARAGTASLTLRLEGPVSGTVVVGDVVVHADLASAVAAAEPEGGEPTVSFLKESQWKTGYATAPAETRTLRASVRAPGEIVSAPGSAAVAGAPATGRLVLDASVRVGAVVTRGQRLGKIVPLGDADRPGVEGELASARTALALARDQLTRTEALVPAVASERTLQVARAEVEAAQGRVQALESRRAAWSGDAATGAEVRAPVGGAVAAVRARDGEIVQAGDRLVDVVSDGAVWVVAHVAELDADRVRGTPGLQVRIAGRTEPVVLDAASGAEVVSVGPAVDPVDRTVPVVVAWPNPTGVWPGAFVDTRVFLPVVADAVAVPAAAVVDDGGVPVVFVMDGGESFFKRRVEVGARDGDWVALSRGVEAGERVVSVGAYEVLLATSAGGIPAHGHQH